MNRSNLIERRFDFETRALPIDGEDNQGSCGLRVMLPGLIRQPSCLRWTERSILSRLRPMRFLKRRWRTLFSTTTIPGRVMARTRNKTPCNWPLMTTVFLLGQGLTERKRVGRCITTSRTDISTGMSFRFTIGSEAFDSENRTWTILRAKRLYDVSAVDIPAYDDTLIEARKADAEAVARESQRKVETELARQRLALKTKLLRRILTCRKE